MNTNLMNTGLTAGTTTSRWPLERILFAMAGSVTLLSALLAALVSPWFLILTAFVGVNQWMYVTLRGCPASIVLKRFGAKSQCRW
jgi:Zn-dependent protease